MIEANQHMFFPQRITATNLDFLSKTQNAMTNDSFGVDSTNDKLTKIWRVKEVIV